MRHGRGRDHRRVRNASTERLTHAHARSRSDDRGGRARPAPLNAFRRRLRTIAFTFACASLLAAPYARAADEAQGAQADKAAENEEQKGPTAEELKDKTEWAAVPVLGGSTDIGIQFGGATTITHVGNNFRPYWWKVDVLLSASVKSGPRGTEIVQQSHDMRWDIPGGAGGKGRLMPGIFFDRTVNSGYFGLGNDAPVVTDPQGQVGARYQFKHQEVRTRLNIRTPLGGPWSTMYGWQLRYVNPKAYAESRLSIDAATRETDGSPLIYGLEPLGIGIANGGIIYDTRDDEVIPTKGGFHLGALRFAGATPTESGVYWAGANFIFRGYKKIPNTPVILAGRLFVDLMAGHVPFYDMSQAGAFVAIDMPGGPQGIRGVPNGRYSGLIKVVGNVEARSLITSFRFLGSKFQIGGTAFFDTGRVWLDYTFANPRDGDGLGLKYGVGGGGFFVWDTAALFRVDVAYSPDASAANPGFPVGIYVQDSFMF